MLNLSRFANFTLIGTKFILFKAKHISPAMADLSILYSLGYNFIAKYTMITILLQVLN